MFHFLHDLMESDMKREQLTIEVVEAMGISFALPAIAHFPPIARSLSAEQPTLKV
jgi:hypothetical protein